LPEAKFRSPEYLSMSRGLDFASSASPSAAADRVILLRMPWYPKTGK
jgi:hypothetical protein